VRTRGQGMVSRLTRGYTSYRFQAIILPPRGATRGAPGQAWERGKRCRQSSTERKPFIGTRQVEVLPGKGWPPAGSESCVGVSRKGACEA
jgi:hypothetical protein